MVAASDVSTTHTEHCVCVNRPRDERRYRTRQSRTPFLFVVLESCRGVACADRISTIHLPHLSSHLDRDQDGLARGHGMVIAANMYAMRHCSTCAERSSMAFSDTSFQRKNGNAKWSSSLTADTLFRHSSLIMKEPRFVACSLDIGIPQTPSLVMIRFSGM